MCRIKRVIAALMVMGMLFSCIAAAAEDDAAMFRPGDEYKDDDAPKPEEVIFTEQTGLASFSDLQDLSKAGILASLHIMEGYQGTSSFKPNVYISRAEFLEGVMRLLNINTEGETISAVGEFYDVPEGHPYYAVIYTAVRYGIITGQPDNTFEPDSVISYDDALAMLLRGLGYADLAEDLGGYPVGLHRAASRIGLTDGIAVNNTAALMRIEMAGLLYSALETPMAEIAYISEEEVVRGTGGETLLYRQFHVAKDVGVVTGSRFASLNGTNVSNGELEIDGAIYPADDRFMRFVGYKTQFWYDLEDANRLIFMTLHSTVKEEVIPADHVGGYSGGVLTWYTEQGSERRTNLADARILYNGNIPDVPYGDEIFNIADGSIRLIANEGSAYSVVRIEEYENLILKRVAAEGVKVQFFLDLDIPMFEVDSDLVYLDIYSANGAAASLYRTTDKGEAVLDLSGLKTDSVISVYAPLGKTNLLQGKKVPAVTTGYMKIVVSDQKAEGAVTMKNVEDRVVKLNDKEYTVAKSSYLGDDLERIRRDSAQYYLDFGGRIVAAVEDKQGDFVYGYLISARFKQGFSPGELEEVKLMDSKGKIVYITADEKVKINGKAAKGEAEKLLSASAAMLNPSFRLSQLIKYKMNSEETAIKEIQTVTAPVGIADGYSEDQLSRYSETGTYRVGYDTAGRVQPLDGSNHTFFQPKTYFKVPNIENADDKLYAVTMLSERSSFTGEAFDVESLTPGVMLLYDDASGASALNNYAVMFDEAFSALNEEGNVVTGIRVATGYGVQTFYSDDSSVCDGLERGQLIFIYGAEDEIDRIDPVIYTAGDMLQQRVTPSNLPPLDPGDNFGTNQMVSNSQFTRAAQVYEVVDSANFILQSGPIKPDSDGERTTMATARFSNSAWMKGGAILYQADGKEITIRQATIGDLRSVQEYGSERASIVLYHPHEGAGRQYVIYNF